MTFSDLTQLVWQKLGSQSTFYPADEIGRAVNCAQRLLCLVYPRLLRQRATLTVSAANPFVDLRQLQDGSGNTIGTRLRQVRRVVLGSVLADAPVENAATGELHVLRPAALASLSACSRDWFRQPGPVRHYYLHGRVWLGLYRRPVTSTTLTIVFDAAPRALVDDADTPQIAEGFHDVIAEIAAGLALVKEGTPRSLELIQAALALAKEGTAA